MSPGSDKIRSVAPKFGTKFRTTVALDFALLPRDRPVDRASNRVDPQLVPNLYTTCVSDAAAKCSTCCSNAYLRPAGLWTDWAILVRTGRSLASPCRWATTGALKLRHVADHLIASYAGISPYHTNGGVRLESLLVFRSPPTCWWVLKAVPGQPSFSFQSTGSLRRGAPLKCRLPCGVGSFRGGSEGPRQVLAP